MDVLNSTQNESGKLRRTVKDLIARTTLAAYCQLAGYEELARTLGEALRDTLSLDLLYLRFEGITGEIPIEVLCARQFIDASQEGALKAALTPLPNSDQAEQPATIFAEGLGTLSTAVVRFGTGVNHGVIIAASRNATFPTDEDQLLLEIGANQSEIAMQRKPEPLFQESEVRYRAMLETALDCIITMDHHGNVVEFNPAAERTFGYSRAEVVGRELAGLIIPPSLRERHRQGMSRYLAGGEGPVIGKRIEIAAMHADGSEFPVELAITRIPGEGPPIFTAYLRDISERTKAEHYRNARLGVTQALNQASDVRDGAGRVLRAVCDNLSWDAGFFWTVNRDGAGLECIQSWHKPELPLAEFEEASFSRAFKPGEGLPGRVWSTDEAHWLLDVMLDANFPRAASASINGLHSAFACPVADGGRVIGVMEFFTRRIREPDPDLLEMMGTVAGSVGQFIQRRSAEQELRQNEAELADFFENATVGIHWVGSDGIILRSNKAGLDMLGYSREDYVGRPVTNFHEDEDVRTEFLQRLQAGDKLNEFPARLRCKDGSIKQVLIDSSVLWKDGTFVHARCFTRDVTERKQAEEASRESEERFRGIFNQTVAGVAQTDMTGRFLVVNQRYCEIVGRTADELSRLRMQEITHADDLSHNLPLFEAMVQGGPPFEIEKRYVRPDGSHVWVNNSVSLIRGSEGQPKFVVAVAMDVTQRKQAEQSLRQSEERFRSLMDQAPFSIQVLSPDGHTSRVNRAWEELWGASISQIRDYNILQDPQLEAKGALSRILQAFAGEPALVPAIQYDPAEAIPDLTKHMDAVRWVAAVAYPLKDDIGRIREIVLVHQDITAQRRAEAALRESEERLRLALEAGRMGVWDWNIRTNPLQWTDSLEPLHGLAPGTFGGTFDHFQQLIHVEDRELVNLAIRQALEKGGEFYVEFRDARQNGSCRWIAGSGKVFPGEDGEPLRMLGVGLDVTQRKRAEHTSRFLADASAALAVLVDFDSTLQKISSLAVPAFADWATVDLAEADGSLRRVSVSHIDPAKVQLAHEIHRRFPPDPAAPQGVWNILRTGQSELVSEITDELLVQSTRDAEMLGILRELGLKSYIGVPLTVRGKTLGVITFINAESGHRYEKPDLAVAEDLANRAAIAIENAQLYRELRETDRRKDEFLATLAHELRNPLAPISNGLQMIRLSGDNPEAVSQACAMMERQLSQMVHLVDDLLDVSRISRGKLDLRREPVDLAVVVNNAVETSRPVVEAHGQELTLDLPSTPILMDADVTRLGQVFANLLNNAAKYSDHGGQIRLTARMIGGEAEVTVKDTGIGIPPSLLPKVFDLFTQVDQSLEKSRGGLGIGLTLVKTLVELHGGSVAAHSEGLGSGSTFTVRLPLLVEKSHTLESRVEEEAAAPVRRRILVVDDNTDAAESLAILLRLRGNEVRTAADGLAAVEAAGEYLPHVILLDIGLPKLNGYDACRRIRTLAGGKQMIIVALTGWGQEEDRRRSADAGFDHHLVKPFNVKELKKLLG